MNTIAIKAHQVQALQLRMAALASAAPMPPAAAPDRHHLGYQEFGLSFHHALSIASHLEHHGAELAASAFALMRPMFETVQRGWWFTTCATDEQAKRFIEEDFFPVRQLVDVAAAVDAQPPFAGTGYFSQMAQTEWNLFHSFTHGGIGALGVYARRPQLDPNFDPDVILTVLDNAAKMAALAAMGMCWVSKIYDPARAEPIYGAVLAMGPQLNR